MTTPSIRRAERMLAGFGLVAAAAALLLALVDARDALTGWLAASAFLQSLPTAALVLLAMMRLVRGKWEVDLRGPASLALAVLPLAALAMVPVIAGMGAIYPWFSTAPKIAFARAWLAPLFFTLRSLAWFALAGFAAWRARGELSEGLAAALLIALALGASFVATDWLMTLDPDFASSAFGSQVLELEVCAGVAALILIRSAAGVPEYSGVLGGLLLTLLLLWAYFQFMPFLIVWSGNLPDGVAWYMVRATPGWKGALAAAGALGGVPMLALFAPQVRKSAGPLALCAASVLAGKAIEFGWLALPGRGPLAIGAALLAGLGLAPLAVAAMLRAARRAEARR